MPVVLLRNAFARLAEEGVEEHWTIGIIESDPKDLLSGLDMSAVRWLPELPGGYLADPFVVQKGTKTSIFAEAYYYADRHGHVVVLDEGPDGTFLNRQGALRLRTHVSYPQVIDHEGNSYLILETAYEDCIRLYRAAPFPTTWAPDRVLIEGFAGVDPTLFRHQERWWLLAGNLLDRDDGRLYAFHSENLLGPWQAHRLNPVKTDLASSRPAGVPFRLGERLFRPAQDCSVCYGGAVIIHHVTHLTPDVFVEEPVAVIRPDPEGAYPAGVHTLNVARGTTVIDAKRHTRSWRRLLVGLANLVRSSSGPQGPPSSHHFSTCGGSKCDDVT